MESPTSHLEWSRRRAAAVAVFAASAMAYFWYCGISNDHFDRIARARQIAVFGDVPFRDFFDPGYFLTLYVSALLQRVLGDHLLGEAILDVSCLAAGTTVVFVLASRASRSVWVGLAAATLVVMAEPRVYDYDKVLFYPLGVYACWRYIERPTLKSLVWVSGTTVVAGLFRYDSGIYLGAAAVASVVVRQWGTWKTAVRHLGVLSGAAVLFLLPALTFVQVTAGLGDAARQIAAYAVEEGGQTDLFRPAAFDMDWTRPFAEWVTNDNAVAWLYYVTLGLPLVAILVLPLRPANRERAPLARILSLAVLTELVVLFILRAPLVAHAPSAVPLLAICGAWLAGESFAWAREVPDRPSGFPNRAVRGMLMVGGTIVGLTTVASLVQLLWVPPVASLQFGRRASELAQSPTALDLLPKSRLVPIVQYLRACTSPGDRVLATWFVPELYFFAGRGFAAGLPVVFNAHWSDEPDQRRSLELLRGQSVPIILTSSERQIESFPLVWDFIQREYDMVREIVPGDDLANIQVWVRRGLPVQRQYAPLLLPCYAAEGTPRS